MSYYTGFNKRKINTTSMSQYLLECARAVEEGYELHKKSRKTDWPYFWRDRYKAQYRKYYIIDDSKIAYFSKKEIDRILGQ